MTIRDMSLLRLIQSQDSRVTHVSQKLATKMLTTIPTKFAELSHLKNKRPEILL